MDYINSLFEFGMAFVILLSVLKLREEKVVKGFHWANVAFPALWGIWNLFYYPSLDQWASFTGGVVIVTINIYYLSLIYKYKGNK